MEAKGLVSVLVTPGELLDRITILRIKCERLSSASRRDEAIANLVRAEGAWAGIGADEAGLAELARELATVNRTLWDAEDRVRDCERRQDFGAGFVACARAILQLNDHRAVLKREVSTRLGLLGGDEEKVYASAFRPCAR